MSNVYYKHLDSLRALAVLLVVVSHWLPKPFNLKNFLFTGNLGVIIFFVISGFLITKILLYEKREINIGNKSILSSLKTFFIRRSLRIFPIYYTVLTIGIILPINCININKLWHFTYLTNIYIYINKAWIDSCSHLWSLAVEEQFYLIWPFIIILIPRKFLRQFLFITVLISPVFRLATYYFSRNEFVNFLMPSCIDALSLGALYAYHKNYSMKISSELKIAFHTLTIILFTITCVLKYSCQSSDDIVIIQLLHPTIYSFIGLSLIILFTQYEFPINIRPIGKISYSLYLFHNFIPELIKTNIFFNFLCKLILLLCLSTISWYLIEYPFSKLKKYFKY